MSRRRDVEKALTALVALALPDATVRGPSSPDRVGANGEAVIHPGDPGDPEVDLCPLAYNYDHSFPVDLTAGDSDALDAMTGAVGRAIVANRTLGGLCDWLEATAPVEDDIVTAGAATLTTGGITLVATYSTHDPLN